MNTINPKKELKINFPLSKVKLAVERIQAYHKKYTLDKSNALFNSYTFLRPHLISAIYCDVALESVDEHNTNVSISIRKIAGGFDNADVNYSYDYIEELFNVLAELLAKSDEDLEAIEVKAGFSKSRKTFAAVVKYIVLIAIVLFIIAVLVL